jgi:type VI secretion system protein ImpA
MPLSFEPDLDALATPLEGESPSGENLQSSEEGRAVRSALRDLREEARRIERRADEGDSSEGGWPAARSICIEALARTDGFAGLATGFTMAGTMVESSWSTLYPAPDPEDGPADEAMIIEERTFPLQRLVGIDSEGLLIPAILHIPLANGRADEQYALCHWRSSRDLVNEQSEEKINLAIERGAVSPAQFEQAVSSTAVADITKSYEDITHAAEVWEALSDLVSSVSGGQASLPAGQIRDLFEESVAAIKTFAPGAIPQPPSPEAGTAENGDPFADGTAEEGGNSAGGSSPGTREDAFRRLESIAAFFEKHDPHSLIAAQIRNIVRLGRLPRDEYYRQLLRDEAALSLLFRAAGMDAEGGDIVYE